MAWTDLFKSKSAKFKADPRVRWFGKLSSYGDYLSSPTEQDWVLEFHDWILRGFELYQSQLAERRNERRPLPRCDAVLRLPKAEMTVFAALRDHGGDAQGRSFPFCFYIAVPTAHWPGPTSDRSIFAARLTQDLHALHREVERLSREAKTFPLTFGERVIELDGIDDEIDPSTWTADAGTIALERWFRAIEAGVKQNSCAAWSAAAARWGAGLAQRFRRSDSFGLCLPIGTGIPWEVQQAGWLAWLERRLDLRRRTLSLLLAGGDADDIGRFGVLARDLTVEDFLLATPHASAVTHVEDLANVDADGVGAESAAPWDTWLEFVRSAPAST